eukprot:TRINITY_DN29337_c0_g1_i1.p1 TRINITY_DN29337_c0_g1~~TRINITY_DN29337_c0_g1_i1.p1  ORF type:complete len:1026 (-),score=236.19 TRINITY_DN29337_c0_g1_i1:54-3062(-)
MAPVEATRSSTSYKEAGNALFKEKRWREAAEQYGRGLEAEGCTQDSADGGPAPDVRGLLLSNRSQCWLNLGDAHRALEDADGCLRLLPEHTKSLFRRALALEKLGREADALADYVKVAKADPKNVEAKAAATRLRDKVLREGARRQEDLLPANLLQVLRTSTGDGEVATKAQKVDACQKLHQLCIHRAMSSTMVAAGAVETLLAVIVAREDNHESEAEELRAAALGALLAMASGEEAEGDADEKVSRPLDRPLADGPLPVPKGAEEARKRLREHMILAEARLACKGQPKPVARLALVVGFVYEPENKEALEVLHDAIGFLEATAADAVNVPRCGIVGLTGMMDTRLRLGKLGRPLVTSESLLKCLESALGTSTCEQQLRGLTSRVFALLADSDRPADMTVDLGAVAQKILEPFLQAEDASLQANGLAALESLFAASDKAAAQVVHGSGAALGAIVNAISHPQFGADGSRAQQHAAECLILALGSRKTRQSVIDSGGIEMLLNALKDGQEGSAALLRAKLVNALAVLAGHNKEVREEIFDRLDLLMELRFAMDTVRDHLSKASPAPPDTQRLRRGLYESCVCLTIHGEFKELLLGAKKTLMAMQELVRGSDLAEDPALAFSYASVVCNLCRSSEDKVRPKSDKFPFNELGDDDIKALEEFYEKMPPESRPERNGEVDAGSADLAERLRSWCVTQCTGNSSSSTAASPASGKASSSLVVAHLARCVTGGSVRAKNLVAVSLKHLCAKQEHRRIVATSGGLRALLGLVDLADETARDAARQALAQILIVTNPSHLQYNEQLDAVRPLVQLMSHRHELLQFEAAMALTNLCSASEELRSRALQAEAWSSLRDLVFSENELLQRAGLEGMCNLTMAPEVVERFADGKAGTDIQLLCAFCPSEDKQSRIAASGALAMLGAYDEVAARIVEVDNFGNLLKQMAEECEGDVEHRLASVLCCIFGADGVPLAKKKQVEEVLKARRKKGFISREANGLVLQALAAGGDSKSA